MGSIASIQSQASFLVKVEFGKASSKRFHLNFYFLFLNSKRVYRRGLSILYMLATSLQSVLVIFDWAPLWSTFAFSKKPLFPCSATRQRNRHGNGINNHIGFMWTRAHLVDIYPSITLYFGDPQVGSNPTASWDWTYDWLGENKRMGTVGIKK